MAAINFVVSPEKSHQRLDKYLVSQIHNYSRASIVKAINQGTILVNGLKKKPSYLLKENDLITGALLKDKEIHNLISLDLVPAPEILYETNDFLVINKPAGINTHPTIKSIQQPSIASWLLWKYPQVKNVGEDLLRPGIVHRLDKDTSGVLILAKNQESFLYFKNLFLNREIKKLYLVLVKGVVPQEQGEITFSLTRSKTFSKRKIVLNFYQDNYAKPALTFFKVKKRYHKFTLLEVIPQTGRTHQIRVHLASIGFPVAGDKLYGVSKKNNDIFPRQMLHAYKIIFPSPSRQLLSIIAPLPNDFKKILNLIAKN
ncbi:MAG: RluA family pseudouridine synthase [Parcubacteria group bacterium]|nr:RluA family pseudouridine synthase [Parcubacteria group bacterium]